MFRLGAKRRRIRGEIRDLPFLRGLTPRDLSFLARYADVAEVGDGRVLVREGAHPAQLLIVVRGRATATSHGFPRRTLCPGDVVGIEMLAGADHPETVVASGRAGVLVIGRRQLTGLLRVAPSFSVALLEYAAAQLTRPHAVTPQAC